jgi:hypothetical protein
MDNSQTDLFHHATGRALFMPPSKPKKEAKRSKYTSHQSLTDRVSLTSARAKDSGFGIGGTSPRAYPAHPRINIVLDINSLSGSLHG